MSQDSRRSWNLALLGAGAILCVFAIFVLIANLRSTEMRRLLTQSASWSAELNEALVVVQTNPPFSERVDRALMDVLAVSGEIQRSPLVDAKVQEQAAAVEAHTRGLRTSLSDPTLAASERTQLIRVAGGLDKELHLLTQETERSMQTAWTTVQITNVGAIGLAVALVLLLAGLRRRALAAEAMQADLEAALAQAESAREKEGRASRAKSDFLATVSHEIRTPLNAILGSAELLETPGLSHTQAERVGVIRAGGEALLGLIDSVLDLSRIESGELELRPRPFEIHKLLEETVLLFVGKACEKGLELNLQVGDTMPSLLSADPDRLRQVLVHLLDNAIKFTERGEVLIRATWTPDGMLVEVQDTGPGIAPHDQPRIMQSFTQLTSSRRSSNRGVGLGLPISLSILTAMGGGLAVRSQPGDGSCFRARVPATVLSRPETPPLTRGHGVAVGNSLSARRVAEQLRMWGEDGLWVPSLEGLSPEGISHLFLDPDVEAPPEWEVPITRLQPPATTGPAATTRGVLALPLRPSALRRALDQPVAEPTPELPAANPRLRVLVVDDHEANRTVMRDMLEALDSSVLLAAGGAEALHTLASEAVDLVFMDVDMPDMDGLECTRRLRSEGRTLPVLGLSGHATQEARDAALGAGMDDYLTKPVRLVTLRQALTSYEGGRS